MFCSWLSSPASLCASQPADFAAAAVGAAKIAAVGHQAAAQRRGHQQIEKASIAMAGAELHFADCRRGGVVFDEHGNPEHIADQIVDAHRRPGRVVGGLIRQMRPRDIVRKRDADADEALAGDAGFGEHRPTER